MKNGSLVRIKQDITIEDNCSMFAVHENERKGNKSCSLHAGEIYTVQRLEYKKDVSTTYFREKDHAGVPFTIPKGVYIHLSPVKIDLWQSIIGISEEQAEAIAEEIEERLITETISCENEWYDASGSITSIIEEYQEILNENKEKYPLGINVSIEAVGEDDYYDFCNCVLKRTITGHRLETKKELEERKEKALILSKKKSEAAKKARLAKAAEEKELYEKLKTKFEQGEINR